MLKKINMLLDLILLVCVILFIGKLIQELIINSKIKYPSDCVNINDNYYCRIRNDIEDQTIKL